MKWLARCLPRSDLGTNQDGFSLIDVLVTMALISILSGIAVGVSPAIVRMARGDAGAQALDAFFKRHRDMAVARRRDIEIRFILPNQVQSAQRAVPDPPNATPVPTVLETMSFEGRIQYMTTTGVPDTPDGFGNATPVTVGGTLPVIFSSEGSFIDATNNPVNATISLGVDQQPLTQTAVTILGATGSIQRWRWNGASWVR